MEKFTVVWPALPATASSFSPTTCSCGMKGAIAACKCVDARFHQWKSGSPMTAHVVMWAGGGGSSAVPELDAIDQFLRHIEKIELPAKQWDR